MRTTVTLDDDVTAAVDTLRRHESIGVSAAVNRLIRDGLVAAGTRRPPSGPRELPTHDFGPMIDVTCVAEAIEQLEGPRWR